MARFLATLFPTRVGMIRLISGLMMMAVPVPHTRGDDPSASLNAPPGAGGMGSTLADKCRLNRDFVATHGGAGSVPAADDMEVVAPVHGLKLKSSPEGEGLAPRMRHFARITGRRFRCVCAIEIC